MTEIKNTELEQARTNKQQADGFYNTFKQELKGIFISDEQDLSGDELENFEKMSNYDRASALYTAYKLGYSRRGLDTSINKEVARSIENINEVEYVKTLVQQLQDNHGELTQAAETYAKTRDAEDLNMVVYEVNRQADRAETLFNLAADLLQNLDTKLEEAVGELIKAKELK